MESHRETEIWKSIFRENTDALNSIAARQGNVYGSVEIDFCSQFQNKEGAMEARMLLRDLFTPSKTTHLYTMNNETGYECILSIVTPVNAESITDIEAAMTGICKPIGGEDVTWGFEDDKRTRH